MWRGHDQKVADHAYHDLYEHEPSTVDVPKVPEPYGVSGPVMIQEAAGESLLADAIRNEDELEHEEPTPEEAAGNELAPEAEEPK